MVSLLLDETTIALNSVELTGSIDNREPIDKR
jgi:hypothetical protein